MTQQELGERREKGKGLYFSYNEKYTPEYKCKNEKLFKLEVLIEEEGEQKVEIKEEAEPTKLKIIKLSLSFIAGSAP